jgi:pimeloyl-ACP methyl ester carboxylesterase
VIETARKRRGLARALWSRVPSRLAYRIAWLSGEVDTATIREEDFVTYWDHISVMDPDIFLSMLRLAGDHSAKDLLPKIEVPSLVIAADRDTFTPPELAKAMADEIPGAEFMRIRGGSHAAPVEQPGTISLRIEKFLLEHLPKGW